MAISISINQQQMSAVSVHLYAIQTMSRAQLNLTPGETGLFHLLVSGSKEQVETARDLLSNIILSTN